LCGVKRARAMQVICAPWQGADLQWVQLPPGKGSLQPVAIGAAVEVTKLPKPSMERVASGDSASRRAVTGVNAEQASKRVMWEPTQQMSGEGRRHRFSLGERRQSLLWSHRGNGDGTSAQGDQTQHGKPQAAGA